MGFKAGWLLTLVVLGGSLLGARGLESSPKPILSSAAALVEDQGTGEVLFQKGSDTPVPIASITKLMTAMVVLDGKQDLEEPITILEEDKDTLRHSRSRLPVGTTLTRGNALLLALMSSENRAAHALGRTYPGGIPAFVTAMNAKAKALGLTSAHFQDPAGLSSGNVCSPKDLAKIVDAAHHFPVIRSCTTTEETTIQSRLRVIPFHNTNRLLQSSRWHIGLSKTGFIDEAGQCLVMQAEIGQRPVLIVLLDASGRGSRFGDAERLRQWMEGAEPAPAPVVRVARVRSARVARAPRVAQARVAQPRVAGRRRKAAAPVQVAKVRAPQPKVARVKATRRVKVRPAAVREARVKPHRKVRRRQQV